MASASLSSKSKSPGNYLIYGLLGALALAMLSDFVFRGLFLAFKPAKTDFSELYTSAWLWRHGLNFYNSAITTSTQLHLVGVSVRVAPIYPPTTFALLSPFTFLPFGWANLLWLSLGFVGIAATIFLLWRLGGFRSWNVATMALLALLLSFDPLHQAFHLGNVVLLVAPLAFYSTFLAERGKDWKAGLVLGVVVCLKPQIGIWVLLYYLFRRRSTIFLGALASGLAVGAVLLLHPAALLHSIPDYRANLRYWFAPGRPYGFTEGALPFHVNIIQVILYPWLHSAFLANVIAYLLFASGCALWFLMLRRTNFRIPAPLAIASLLALSFLALYHSVSDATVLTLALCWAIPSQGRSWTRARIATCVLFLIMMLPGHSLLMRLSPHIAPSITTAWWWSLFIARYFVWLLFALNITLLYGMWESAQDMREPRDRPQRRRFSILRANSAIYLE